MLQVLLYAFSPAVARANSGEIDEAAGICADGVELFAVRLHPEISASGITNSRICSFMIDPYLTMECGKVMLFNEPACDLPIRLSQ